MVLTSFEYWAHGSSSNSNDFLATNYGSTKGSTTTTLDLFSSQRLEDQQANSSNPAVSYISSNGYYGFVPPQTHSSNALASDGSGLEEANNNNSRNDVTTTIGDPILLSNGYTHENIVTLGTNLFHRGIQSGDNKIIMQNHHWPDSEEIMDTSAEAIINRNSDFVNFSHYQQQQSFGADHNMHNGNATLKSQIFSNFPLVNGNGNNIKWTNESITDRRKRIVLAELAEARKNAKGSRFDESRRKNFFSIPSEGIEESTLNEQHDKYPSTTYAPNCNFPLDMDHEEIPLDPATSISQHQQQQQLIESNLRNIPTTLNASSQQEFLNHRTYDGAITTVANPSTSSKRQSRDYLLTSNTKIMKKNHLTSQEIISSSHCKLFNRNESDEIENFINVPNKISNKNRKDDNYLENLFLQLHGGNDEHLRRHLSDTFFEDI